MSTTVSTVTLRRLRIPAPGPTTARGRSRFLLLGVVGYLAGGVLGCALAAATGLVPQVVVLLTALSGLTFFAVAFGTKVLVGRESLIYLHHELAILAVTAAALVALRAPVAAYLDIVQVGVSTFLAFGRIGCWTAACCHGRPAPWGTTSGADHVRAGLVPEYRDVPLLPTQLAEATLAGALVVTGSVLVCSGAPPGTSLTVSVIAYGLGRWALEPLRGDVGRAVVLGVGHTRITIVGQHLVFAGLAVAGRLPYAVLWTGAAAVFLGLLGASRRRPPFVPELVLTAARSIRTAAQDTPSLIETGRWRVSVTAGNVVHVAVSCTPRRSRLERATLVAIALAAGAGQRSLDVAHAPRALHAGFRAGSGAGIRVDEGADLAR